MVVGVEPVEPGVVGLGVVEPVLVGVEKVEPGVVEPVLRGLSLERILETIKCHN